MKAMSFVSRFCGTAIFVVWLHMTSDLKGLLAGPRCVARLGDPPETLVTCITATMVALSFGTAYFNKRNAVYASLALIVLWLCLGVVIVCIADW